MLLRYTIKRIARMHQSLIGVGHQARCACNIRLGHEGGMGLGWGWDPSGILFEIASEVGLIDEKSLGLCREFADSINVGLI